MPELRIDAKSETVAVIDGFCSATGRCRTAFINGLLEEWAERKLHEARVVVRVADANTGMSELRRKASA